MREPNRLRAVDLTVSGHKDMTTSSQTRKTDETKLGEDQSIEEEKAPLFQANDETGACG